MKLIVAVVGPLKLDAVAQALVDLGIKDFTVTECRRYAGNWEKAVEIYRGKEIHAPKYVSMWQVATVALDDAVDAATQAIKDACDGVDYAIVVADVQEVHNSLAGPREFKVAAEGAAAE